MRTERFISMLVLFFCAMGFTACSDDDEKGITPLSFEKEHYEVPLFEGASTKSITIKGGNKDYTATVEKPEILEASINTSSTTEMGYLLINPKQKGETTVTVKDNVSNETVDLSIKVTDGYLAYVIKESNHPALAVGTIAYLINNEAKDCYFFLDNHVGNNLYGTPIGEGTYSFSVKAEDNADGSSPSYIAYLTLNYREGKNGAFTDAAIAPTPHELRLDSPSQLLTNVLQTYLGVDWEELKREATPQKRDSPAPLPTLRMTIDNTDYAIIGILNMTPTIPENILK